MINRVHCIKKALRLMNYMFLNKDENIFKCKAQFINGKINYNNKVIIRLHMYIKIQTN